MFLKQHILAATLVGFSVSSAFAASCNLPRTEIVGERGIEFGNEFQSYVQGLMSSEAHAIFGQRLIDKYTSQLAGATRSQDIMIFESKLGVARIANEYANYLKLATAAKSLSDGDIDAVSDMVIGDATEKAFEKFLSQLGITSNGTLVGALIATIKITKESYSTLEHEDCLANIDASYYNFMQDKNLRWKNGKTLPAGAVEYYFERYVYGAGPAPYGSERMQNRRNFQCYINEVLPEGRRIEVSSMGSKDRAGGSFIDFFNVGNTLGNVIGSAVDVHDNSRVRTPLTMMLRDFNRRKDIEEQIHELQRLRRTPEFREFEAAIEAMRATEKIEEWLCNKLKDEARAAELDGTSANQPASSTGGDHTHDATSASDAKMPKRKKRLKLIQQ